VRALFLRYASQSPLGGPAECAKWDPYWSVNPLLDGAAVLVGWAIVALAVAYVGLLFIIAWFGDRQARPQEGKHGRPLIYALSLAVYCTSWTFFGSVGLAASSGYDFVPVYLGPILMFAFGGPLILRIVRLAKSQNITSVADFLAARYGKSPAVAAIVALVAVIGVLPYIALQLKAIVISTETLLGGTPLAQTGLQQFGMVETAIVVAPALALFAVLFGTRHIDATEHQDGLMLAIAAESVVKLVSFLIVGIFVMFAIFGGLEGFERVARYDRDIQSIFDRAFHGGTWLTVTFLSFVCIILLPRQFHVTVVENRSEREIRRARWLFPLYLVLINLFVVPIAAAGLYTFPKGIVDADMYVLALPMVEGSNIVTTFAYIGGLSAATAMVIVESIALAIMVCNGLVVPLLLRYRLIDPELREDLAGPLLAIRRAAIFAVVLLSYLVYRALGQSQGLAAIGLVAFAAIAQLAPAFFGGLVWRKGTARGAIAGVLAGISMWAYTLLLPWIVRAGFLPADILSGGPFGILFLRPQALFLLDFEPLTHGVLWSLAANVAAYIVVSLMHAPEPIERLQAHVFVFDDLARATPVPAFRLWRTSITAGDLQSTVARYLGPERAERSFAEYAAGRNVRLRPDSEADIQTVRFTEHLLASAIGAASARLVLSLLLRRSNVGSQSALRLLDDASEALQYNRDLLQSALDQVRHGLGVFDKDMALICWNRQFRELLNLPLELGRVGLSLERILLCCAERGDFGEGPVDKLVADRMMRLAVHKETFQEKFDRGRRILEIRTAPMPQGGIVCTFSDITERVEAASELARVNESLERRVRERTAELLEVNRALAVAKAKADEANLDKTRFLAAASHDLLQPLNAARLYASSLAERRLEAHESQIARNIDASLAGVEEILSALLDISRIDAGRFEVEFSPVRLEDLFESLKVEFEPMAREKGLDLRVAPTSLWVMSDRKLLRRVLQNLVSNAVKYTRRGGVVLGARWRGDQVVVEVHDTGPGIPKEMCPLIFKEFHRLEDTARSARGLGLGLSIVERIGRVLNAPISVDSTVGRGSVFSIALLRTAAQDQETAVSILPPPPIGALKGCVTLCIENEPTVLASMQTMLAGWGCTVLTAESGVRAVQALAESGLMPDIILADYHLDQGTGLEAIAEVRRAAGLEIPAVVITADHSPEVQRAARQADYVLLRKPLKVAALRSVLSQRAMRRPAAE
jgi:Na+/proline symporter/signal transduction histidine kinase